MRIHLCTLCCLFFNLLLSGCIETTDIYTINPDSSGKVVHEVILLIDAPMFGDDVGPEIQLKQSILSELKQAKGVEAWDDISYKYHDEETVYLKGTAYFKDLSQLKFHNSGVSISLYDNVLISRDEKQFRLELKSSKSNNAKNSQEQKTDTVKPVLTDAEVEQKAVETKKRILEAKAMLTDLLADIKLDRTFYLPGTIASSSNFEQNKDGSVRNNFEGTQLIELMTKKLDDEEWLRQQIKSGKVIDQDPLPTANILNGHLFGENGPIAVVINTTDTPLFDYDAELAQAKIYYDDFLNTLEPFKPPVPLKVNPDTVVDFSVAAIRYVAFADVKNGIQPLGYQEGYTLAVMGTLPEKAVSLRSGKLETALTDTGVSLLPESDWDREIRWPKLSNDGHTVLLDLDLLKPAEDVRSLQKISGTFGYLASSGEYSVIDLGIDTFTEGATGNQFGAKVLTATTESLIISVDVVKDSIKSFELFDTAGDKVDTVKNYSWSPTYTHLKFSPMLSDRQLPLQGKVHLEILTDFKVYEMEFNLTDVPLLGR